MNDMIAEVGEKIDVIAVFTKNKVVPLIFSWKNKRYTELRPISVWTECQADSKLIFILVRQGISHFELCFNAKNLEWTLMRTWREVVKVESNR